MGKCKYCGKSGFFLNVGNDGLCVGCRPLVLSCVQNDLRLIQESLEIILRSKNLDTKLSRCDFVVEVAQRLHEEYESKGLNLFGFQPLSFAAEYGRKRGEILLEGLTADLKATLDKASLAATLTSKINVLAKMLGRVREYKGNMSDGEALKPIEQQLIGAIHAVKLQAFLEAAQKAEYKRQPKKALDQYLEALYFLEHDEIDDSRQRKDMAAIQVKIAELERTNGIIVQDK